MRKRILAIAALLGLALGLGSGVPAHASIAGGAQATSNVSSNYSNYLNAVGATLTITDPSGDNCTGHDHIGHWIGIQSAYGPNPGHLVQAGWSWDYYGDTIGFFWEYAVVGGGAGSVGPVDITSQVLGTWGETRNQVIGHQVYFHLWHSTSDRWGLQIEDLNKANANYSAYVYDTGYADDFLNNEAIVSTEDQYNTALLNDGTETIKQAEYAYNGTWYWFNSSNGTQWATDMVDNGHTLETATTANSNQYAYHVHQLCT
jgi:hypothetical protein